MKRFLLLLALCLGLPSAHAVSPYIYADKVASGSLNTALSAVEKKLTNAGFELIGRHLPPGLPEQGVLVLTDKAVLEALRGIGGSAIVGAGIRVAVKSDGTVSSINPEYWYRAYLRKNYGAAEAAIKAAGTRLSDALGRGAAFGGDVAADDLPNYRYMFGMERFDDPRSQLRTYESFDEAIKTIRGNLAKNVRKTAQVYEVVLADKQLAVFGVATNDVSDGEAWWVNKIGPDNMAALPWEVFVVGHKAYSLYGRYRTALGWPTLGMGSFMGIVGHPDSTLDMMRAVAGALPEKSATDR